MAVVVSVTGDEESNVCVCTVGGSPVISGPLSRSGSSGMLTAVWIGVSGGVGRSSASSTTRGGGRARGEMMIAGAVEGSVGLRDHMASSCLDFSTGRVADCFTAGGEVMIGDDSSGDDAGGTSGDGGTSSGTGTGSDTGSVTGSGTGSITTSVTGSGASPRVGSRTGSGVGSGAGSDM